MEYKEFLMKFHLKDSGFDNYLLHFAKKTDYVVKHSRIVQINDDSINDLIANFKKYNMNRGLEQLSRQKAESIVHEKVEHHAESFSNIKASYENEIVTQQQKDTKHDQITCPKCGSTQVSTGARGWKWTTGLIGSGKTVNRCGNCGKVWKPIYKK